MVGCTRKASTPVENGSDGLLLLLNDEIPDDYNVFFNGWDRSNMLSLSGVGIHHPSGDYMKSPPMEIIRQNRLHGVIVMLGNRGHERSLERDFRCHAKRTRGDRGRFFRLAFI